LYPASRRVENLCHHALGQEQKQKWAKMRCWHCQSNQMTGQAHDALGKHHAGSVWVVLPTYNEADNLPLMIEAVLSLPGGFDILVVDDNSSDGTGEVADRLAQANPCVHVLHRTGKMGLGTAYLAGMRCAIEAGAQTAITMDADLSHDPGLLPQMARLAERFDIVVGSRLAKGGGLEGLSRFRRLFSIAANAYLRLVLRVPCSDFTSGYRAYGARAMRALAAEGITGKGHAVLPELLFRALRRGLTMTEIPIRFRRRHAGRSKVGLRAIFESLILPWRVRFSVR
jgi:dolichol-phosphate mannosyltransferase